MGNSGRILTFVAAVRTTDQAGNGIEPWIDRALLFPAGRAQGGGRGPHEVTRAPWARGGCGSPRQVG